MIVFGTALPNKQYYKEIHNFYSVVEEFEMYYFVISYRVNEAIVACQTSHEKAGLSEKQVASLENAYRSTSLLMKHGNTTYLEVLTAQQSYLN